VQERLQKILSRAGVASRRASEQVILQGRVSLNGEIVRELGTKADITQDDLRVDGVRIRPPKQPVYLLLNKPKGIVSTRHDPEGRRTVMDLVPPVAGLFPVGRLDVTTEGLILLTNDGAFAEKVAHPRYEVARVYRAKVHGVPDPGALARLKDGVRVEGERLAVDGVRIVESDKNSWVEVRLHEGKHHEVKRMLEAVGHPVSKLRRVAIGPLTDKGLNPGEFRHLTPNEIRTLSAGGKPRPRPPGELRPAPSGHKPRVRPPGEVRARSTGYKPRPRTPGGARTPGSGERPRTRLSGEVGARSSGDKPRTHSGGRKPGLRPARTKP
jgi:23S rRNA pseudouridine2605 synthase